MTLFLYNLTSSEPVTDVVHYTTNSEVSTPMGILCMPPITVTGMKIPHFEDLKHRRSLPNGRASSEINFYFHALSNILSILHLSPVTASSENSK